MPTSNYMRYGGAVPALQVFEDYKMVLHTSWAFAAWLDVCSDVEYDELDYLRKLEAAHILTAKGYKRINQLMKEKNETR